MSRCSPFEVHLRGEDRRVLEGRASSRSASHSEVVRARIVLLAAGGVQNLEIAKRVGVCVDVASRWRKRFCQQGLAGLKDRPRSGRPRTFGSAVVAGVKALACEPPERRDVPLSRWSSHELAAQAVSEGLVDAISSSTVRRWLHADASSRGATAHGSSRVTQTSPTRQPVSLTSTPASSRVSRSDRRTTWSRRTRSPSFRRCRCHRGRPAGSGHLSQVEFEYERGGTLAYMGAYDVHRAHLIGTIADKTGIVPFMELVDKVMTQEPYASARMVYWVVDNGSSHNGKRSIDRMAAAWPNARLVHLPVHASWLNQIEIVFSIIQRKVVKPADFADLSIPPLDGHFV